MLSSTSCSKQAKLDFKAPVVNSSFYAILLIANDDNFNFSITCATKKLIFFTNLTDNAW